VYNIVIEINYFTNKNIHFCIYAVDILVVNDKYGFKLNNKI